jgi:hypothetical protein
MGDCLMQIEGKTIVAVRYMTKKEMNEEYWQHSSHDGIIIELSDGSMIYPSCDPEGNGPGSLFGKDSKGTAYYIYPSNEDILYPSNS